MERNRGAESLKAYCRAKAQLETLRLRHADLQGRIVRVESLGDSQSAENEREWADLMSEDFEVRAEMLPLEQRLLDFERARFEAR